MQLVIDWQPFSIMTCNKNTTLLCRDEYIDTQTETGCHRADSKFAPSQWATSLQSNAVSHWQGANLESTLLWCGVAAVALTVHHVSRPLTHWTQDKWPSIRKLHLSCLFFNENCLIFIRISLKCVPEGPVSHKPLLIQNRGYLNKW